MNGDAIDLHAAADVADAIEQAGGTVEDVDVDPGHAPEGFPGAIARMFGQVDRTEYTFTVTVRGDTNDVVEPITDPDDRVVDAVKSGVVEVDHADLSREDVERIADRVKRELNDDVARNATR